MSAHVQTAADLAPGARAVRERLRAAAAMLVIELVLAGGSNRGRMGRIVCELRDLSIAAGDNAAAVAEELARMRRLADALGERFGRDFCDQMLARLAGRIEQARAVAREAAAS